MHMQHTASNRSRTQVNTRTI